MFDFISKWRAIVERLAPARRVVRIDADVAPARMPPRDLVLLTEGSEDWSAVMLCPCGCGDRVELPLFAEALPRWNLRTDSRVGQLCIPRFGAKMGVGRTISSARAGSPGLNEDAGSRLIEHYLDAASPAPPVQLAAKRDWFEPRRWARTLRLASLLVHEPKELGHQPADLPLRESPLVGILEAVERRISSGAIFFMAGRRAVVAELHFQNRQRPSHGRLMLA